MQTKYRLIALSLCCFAATLPCALPAEELEAFTEPYKRVAIPAAEVGVIDRVLVSEGDSVSKKQMLARLDDRVLQATLLVAQAAKDALGNRQAAEADLKMRTQQLESYRQLRARGNATQRELERAEADHLQSQSRLQAVNEELEVRRLEYERVKAQINQRRIESPIEGVVVEIEKEEGEFVSPTDPVVMHIVQLKMLKAVFSAPMSSVSARGRKALRPGQTVKVVVGPQERVCEGVIEFVSPVADAQSATVRVKIRIPNEEGIVQSGAVCRWDMTSAAPVERLGQNVERLGQNVQRLGQGANSQTK